MKKNLTFQEVLTKYNGGISRGAQFKLANALDIDPSNIRRWIKGETNIKETLRPKVAKELGITVDVLMESLKPLGYRDAQGHNLMSMLRPKEQGILKGLCERGNRDPINAIRQLLLDVGEGRLVPARSLQRRAIPKEGRGAISSKKSETANQQDQSLKEGQSQISSSGGK